MKELRRKLRDAGDGFSKELGQAGKKAADVIAAAARSRVPVDSGRAQSSIRATAGRGGKVVGGGAKAPYYPWLDFGGSVGRKKAVHREFIATGRYLYPAFTDKRGEVLDVYVAAVHEVLRKADLI